MTVSYGKRGMALEQGIIHTNSTYRAQGIAIVDKIPTPWRVYYDKRSNRSQATPLEKSTVDFSGTIRGGRSIHFEAKSTQNKTSFPLKNVSDHQVDYLSYVHCLGAISFFIIEFETLNERYLVPIDFIVACWERMKQGGRKSIAINELRENSWLIPTTNVYCDYLSIVFKHLWE
ncbi:Holliday junction resolvase RecU [Halalkalibacterium halodurans]|uniref:Holliday junction resolvase RecU n=1 Tax=Halalkalibacterium halodurans TaxID=86665 RepID=A0A0M0KNF0_ALKHA|nr:Holliday junction resolvase RecU [Halalkalibacterium halodurans]TPE70647.1 Holliday junction resolvase RecU [Halalkalibacterium halodurans]